MRLLNYGLSNSWFSSIKNFKSYIQQLGYSFKLLIKSNKYVSNEQRLVIVQCFAVDTSFPHVNPFALDPHSSLSTGRSGLIHSLHPENLYLEVVTQQTRGGGGKWYTITKWTPHCGPGAPLPVLGLPCPPPGKDISQCQRLVKRKGIIYSVIQT